MARNISPERQLGRWMEDDGNWQLKAMLAAEVPDHPLTHEELGEAMLYMQHNPEVKEYHLSQRDEDDPFRRMGDRRIRPLSYDEGEYQEVTHARELASDGTYDERELKRTGVPATEYIGRTLVSGTTSQKDILWREQLLDTVVMGAEEVQFARDAINMIDVNTTKGDHPVRGDDEFADTVSKGAEIPFDEVDWDQQSWNTEKRGRGAFIEEELVEDALIDIIEENIRHIGRAVENGLNRITVNELIDQPNQDNSVTTSATDGLQNANLSYLFEARRRVVSQSFPEPDSAIVHPKFETGFIVEDRNNINFADRAGTGDYVRQAALPPVANIEDIYTVPGSVYDGTGTYDWGGTSNHIGATVFNSDLIYGYLYRDLETKDFDDPIRDLQGANVRAEYDVGLAQTDSAATISES